MAFIFEDEERTRRNSTSRVFGQGQLGRVADVKIGLIFGKIWEAEVANAPQVFAIGAVNGQTNYVDFHNTEP